MSILIVLIKRFVRHTMSLFKLSECSFGNFSYTGIQIETIDIVVLQLHGVYSGNLVQGVAYVARDHITTINMIKRSV